MTSGAGYVLQPAITIPDDATSITVSAEGEVSVKTPGAAENQVVGQLTISDFINPSGLDPIGQNLYLETGAAVPRFRARLRSTVWAPFVRARWKPPTLT